MRLYDQLVRENSEVLRQPVALRMGFRLRRLDDAERDQALHRCMVLAQPRQAAVPVQIAPAVADIGGIRLAVCEKQRRQCRAGALSDFPDLVADGAVSRVIRLQNRLRRPAFFRRKRLQRGLRGLRPLRLPAHSVCHGEKALLSPGSVRLRVPAAADRAVQIDPILIFRSHPPCRADGGIAVFHPLIHPSFCSCWIRLCSC